MSEQNPFRIFVTHGWEEAEDYLRVFEFLEGTPNFYYRNLSAPDARPGGDRESEREEWRTQIKPAEVVIALASLARAHPDALHFQMLYAQTCRKPVILMPLFGAVGTLPKSYGELATETSAWDARELSQAVRRLARGENTARWDVVEFKLD